MYVTMQPYRECQRIPTYLTIKNKKSIEQLRTTTPRQTLALELLVVYCFRILLVYPCALYYGILILSRAHGACPNPLGRSNKEWKLNEMYFCTRTDHEGRVNMVKGMNIAVFFMSYVLKCYSFLFFSFFDRRPLLDKVD